MAGSPQDHNLRVYFPYGFPLSRQASDQFELESLMDGAGAAEAGVGFAAVRAFTQQVNEKRHQETHQVAPLKAEELIFLGLITDVLRFLARRYFLTDNPGSLAEGVDRVSQQLGATDVAKLPVSFVRLFPPRSVLRGWYTAQQFLAEPDVGIANLDSTFIEIILLYLTVGNPATRSFRDLFDDSELQRVSPYVPFVVGLEEFCEEQAPFGAEGMSLFHFLRAPMRDSPDSLAGQVAFIQSHWGQYLPTVLRQQLTLAQDVWEEDQRLRGLGPGDTPVLDFGRGLYDPGYPELERFSEDKDWMSNVVLMAKNVHVWLDQLSKRYGRPLHLLSDIPDEELDSLARWGFRGLWLIGLWERSSASRKIKQYMGNPEAAASAYSLYDYSVAAELGGDEAYAQLRERASQRGIRLASDMVPNHMGLDSLWVMEHPDWFIQLDQSPYPWYSFTGGDLSDDDRASLFIEDGYWEHRDAAVVFQRVDKRTGNASYIYHGNDGTSMPWNDTAQLNYLIPEVREAVIQTILHVARMFPIIRFDAAMTLTKKHYQRLWFPKPGEAGAIPSRAEFGMSQAQFDAVFPQEFWREVVDRVAQEAPDTLLLAEAFWLMEGYFVRTLGMHRVYNSAFMNMLKMEENQKYRQTVKNVLEFSPEVLKRFVNFMSNPDERTAIEQFGKGDKYFGVAVLLVTMPGLPMFGHGQIEGLTEKYGMEYSQAYWDEPIDEHMVWRHETEIFPLMRRRQLFSGAQNFALFDFVRPDGSVDENVFAYTNRTHDERALIIYNNAFHETRGRIHTSTLISQAQGNDPLFVRHNLAEALALNTNPGCWYGFRDWRDGLEYLRTGREFSAEGLAVHLHSYQYHAFLDFREIQDSDGSWAQLAGRLAGRGVPSLDEARQEMLLESLLEPFRRLISAVQEVSLVARDTGSSPVTATDEDGSHLSAEQHRVELDEALRTFYGAVADQVGALAKPLNTESRTAGELDLILNPSLRLQQAGLDPQLITTFLTQTSLSLDEVITRTALIWSAWHRLGEIGAAGSEGRQVTDTMERLQDWLLPKQVRDVLSTGSGDPDAAQAMALLAVIVVVWTPEFSSGKAATAATIGPKLFEDSAVREFLRVHEHDGVNWFQKERFEQLLNLVAATFVAELAANNALDEPAVQHVLNLTAELISAADHAGYRLDETLAILSESVS